MGTQIELRHMAFFGAMGAVSKEEIGEAPATEKGEEVKGGAASSYAASPVSTPAEKGSAQKSNLFADCSEIKGTKPLTVPYTVGGKKESVSVCVEGASKMMLESTAGRLDGDIKTALGKVVPATVQIKVAGLNRQEWSGSGFILDPADAAKLLPGMKIEPGTYFIHTNHHVAAEARAITVITADGKRRLVAEVVKSPSGAELLDEVGDTALLMVRCADPLPTAKIGPRSIVEQGDTVLTAGYPLALPRISVTKGIVSQTAQMTGETLLAIQADAPINPGNSGGPLFTLDGTIVGTNTYTFRGANDLTFANAITEQFGLLGTIWQKGAMVRGDLEIDFAPLGYFEKLSPGLPAGVKGAMVGNVVPGSGAEKAGLKAGDIVTEIRVMENGKVVRRFAVDFESEFHYTRILKAVHSLKPGQKVELGIFRRRGDAKAFSYKKGSVELEAVPFSTRTKVAEQSWGIAAVRSGSGDIIVSGFGESTPGALSELGRGEWILSGVRAREIADFKTQPVRSLSDLHGMMGVMRQKGTTQMILYVRSKSNPNVVKTIVLERELGGLAMKREEGRAVA
ncbi:MAG TPA: trypsin-like peptidase domain-containing protein [bacterium]|nr:trypsin-like peptidase domain-containing protein [bacterium]